MKSYGSKQALLVVVLCSLISQLLAADDKTARETCIQQSKLSADDANRVRSATSISKLLQNNSATLECFQLCYYQQVGLIDTSGKITLTKVLAYLVQVTGISDATKLTAALRACESVQATNQCDKVYQFEKCTFNKLGI
ncbi:PREDICTED: uncharacterized protein LOC108374979 [Rhagoletis zephyria]|uniref:uncharacterized protein LOC108374979 n=1 Tax=Rhagoletis zephyria TaxID=28612 RepID=UPI0008118FF0|nr:PREDICTED: uncharacterized protein LOC108374979 [Rhagoletis zephyria]